MSVIALRSLAISLALLVAAAIWAGAASADAPSAPDFSAIDGYVSSQLQDARIPGLALGIVQGDQVVHLAGFGVGDPTGTAVTPTTPFVIGSVSKSFTALAIMQLVEAGKLSLDSPVQRYVSWFALADADASSQITLRQLLSMTSGIPTAAGVDPLSGPASTLEGQVRALASVKPTSAPGARYQYSNANYEILGLVVETVSGQSYGEYVEQHILAPLDMRHTYVTLQDAQHAGLGSAYRYWFGAPVPESPFYRPDFLPAGFIVSTAEDLSHYLIAQLNGGRYGNAQIVSPASIAEMQRGVVSENGPTPAYYGMGWMDSTVSGLPLVWHNGSTNDMHSILVMVPGSHYGVVLLANSDAVLYELLNRYDLIAFNVASMLVGAPTGGSLAGLYLAFDVLFLALIALRIRALATLIRRRPRVSSASQGIARVWGFISSWVLPVLGEVVLPVFALVGIPAILGAPWTRLYRTDLGAIVLLLAALALATMGVRVWRAARRAEPAAAQQPLAA